MNVYISDIDGTIADNTHRQDLAMVKEWDAFFDLCDEDKPIKHMRLLLNDLSVAGRHGAQIVYVTGRPERVRSKTFQWLHDHDFPKGRMFMRQDGDHRPDHIIKVELLAIVRAEIGDPVMVFDDRNSVVKMWRELGVPVAQVAEGDF